MRIIVNDIAASSGGALSILKGFYNYLIQTDMVKENEWIFLLSDEYIEETENIKVIVLDNVKRKWINRLKFDLYSGKRFISSLQPDVVFSLQNTITFGLQCPQVLYMHQSIPFQKVKKFSFFKSEERKLAIYQYIIGAIIKRSIKKADKTVVQTNWIREAVLEATKIPANRVLEIFPHQGDLSEYRNHTLFKKNSFFYPADSSIYKNHQCIYDASEILTEKGINNYNISLTIEDQTERENISYLGNIPFRGVLERYNSSSLIFPSYIETVGLPLIEARQMGTIILVADCPYSREVLEGYENAYFFNPFNPEDLANLMEKVILGEIRKKSISYNKTQLYSSWDQIINCTLKLGEAKNNNSK